jgi:hypothetical protein
MEHFMATNGSPVIQAARVEEPRGITRLHPGVFIRGKEGDTAAIPCGMNTMVCQRGSLKGFAEMRREDVLLIFNR